MPNPKNGDRGICEVCGQAINYYFGWRHDLGESQRHMAWPKRVDYQPSSPILTEADEVILLDSAGPVRLEMW